MRKFPKDISGMKFQMLTPLSLDSVINSKQRWLCKCDCGQTTVVARGDLTNNNTKSCGCARRLRHAEKRNVAEVLGKRFGRWTVTGYDDSKRDAFRWRLLCDCGKTGLATLHSLKHGRTKSCGCLTRERTSEARTTHGATRNHQISRLYRIWTNMKSRCANPLATSYKDYGGRGIMVCSGWMSSFAAFREDMGESPEPNATINRVKNNGHYSCGRCPDCGVRGWERNVQWSSDQFEQANNKRNNRLIDLNGDTKTLAQWSRHTGLDAETISMRIKRGWEIPRALTEPLRGTVQSL